MTKNLYVWLMAGCAVTCTAAPIMAAWAGELTARGVEGAQLIRLTTTVTKGALNIANGRNCLTENLQGIPVLAGCQSVTQEPSETTTVNVIEVAAGRCLTDLGNDEPALADCDRQDKNQQWKALAAGGTDVRNVATSKCLTASGLDKPVKMATCSGLPAQS